MVLALNREERAWAEAQREFYNSRNHKRMWYAKNSVFVNHVLKKFISFAQISKEHRILEIGCGAGRYTIPLVGNGYTVTAVDISERMLEKLQSDVAHIPVGKLSVIKGNINQPDQTFGDGYDCIIGFNVLHHLYDVEMSFSALKSLLCNGGSIAFVEPNARNPLHELDSILDRAWKIEGKKSNSIASKVTDEMHACGFRDAVYEHFGFFPPFLIDLIPGLLNLEKGIERVSVLNSVLPYFMIRAVNIEP